jgi:hypothetical protein
VSEKKKKKTGNSYKKDATRLRKHKERDARRREERHRRHRSRSSTARWGARTAAPRSTGEFAPQVEGSLALALLSVLCGGNGAEGPRRP